MLNNLGLVFISTKEVMKNWRYFSLTLIISFLLFLLAIWLPNLSFVKEIITSQFFSISEKASILWGSLKAFQTNFRPFGRITLVTVSLLFGFNMSLFIFYLRQRIRLQKEAGISFGGVLAGMLGIGCASCGSFVFTSILGVSASTAFLGLLPLRGQEFGILSIIILSISIILTAKKIQEPLVCK